MIGLMLSKKDYIELRSTRLRAEWWIIFVISFVVGAIAIYHFGVWAALISFIGVISTIAKMLLGGFIVIILGAVSALLAYLGNAVHILFNIVMGKLS